MVFPKAIVKRPTIFYESFSRFYLDSIDSCRLIEDRGPFQAILIPTLATVYCLPFAVAVSVDPQTSHFTTGQ